jgi:hypothetical protein
MENLVSLLRFASAITGRMTNAKSQMTKEIRSRNVERGARRQWAVSSSGFENSFGFQIRHSDLALQFARATIPRSLSYLRRSMISFIVPAHNEQACLGRAVQAIHESARATGRPYEIIVVDDASTDATATPCLSRWPSRCRTPARC